LKGDKLQFIKLIGIYENGIEGGTVDQGGQAGGEDDPAELPSLPLQGWSNMRGTTGCY